MQNVCQKCGKLNNDEAQFCTNCGTALSNKSQSAETKKTVGVVPAEQASVIADKTKEKTTQLTKLVKKLWKGFLLPEQIIVIGIFLGIISFFLPWIATEIDREEVFLSGFSIATDYWYLFLYIVAMLVSLALIYFSQGASVVSKIKLARWQILIGAFCLAVGIICLAVGKLLASAINSMIKGSFGFFGGYGNNHEIFSVSFSFGLGMFLLSALLIVAGAFKLQSVLLEKDNK